ncbi:MAG: dihydrodipicolinate synthase family protein [Verrucomicrobia bacterium]|nr:dihydrodipicolinate synthase family protein [Verrucomicrobiota bacterium]MCF7709326.1 dihydrodipicolinate synthase family protein [Verrucomicrobiota bacterium]
MADKTHIQYAPGQRFQKPLIKLVGELLLRHFNGFEGCISIAVGGPGGTGKSSFCRKLSEHLPDTRILNLDDYKTSRTARSQSGIFGAHPDANHIGTIIEHLECIKEGIAFDKPVYNQLTGVADKTERYIPARFNLLDGEISTYRQFRRYIDLSIFIDSDWKTQLNTRITRDIEQRGYTHEKAIATFLQSNLREFARYGAESKKWADIHLYCHHNYSIIIESLTHELFQECEDLLRPSMCPVDIEGLIVPVLTPFKEDLAIDEKQFIRHLEFLSDHGVRRILVNGTTGEFFSLTPDERKQMLQVARRYFPGIIVFQVGCAGGLQTRDQVRMGCDYGADAIICLPPYYYSNIREDGLVRYFNWIAENLDLPFMLYNFPRHTGVPLTPGILGRIPHYGLKDSAADMGLIGATPRYFIGADELIIENHRRGGRGFVSAGANAYPMLYTALEQALAQGEIKKAKSVHDDIIEVNAAIPDIDEISTIKQRLSEKLDGYPAYSRPPIL